MAPSYSKSPSLECAIAHVRGRTDCPLRKRDCQKLFRDTFVLSYDQGVEISENREDYDADYQLICSYVSFWSENHEAMQEWVDSTPVLYPDLVELYRDYIVKLRTVMRKRKNGDRVTKHDISALDEARSSVWRDLESYPTRIHHQGNPARKRRAATGADPAGDDPSLGGFVIDDDAVEDEAHLTTSDEAESSGDELDEGSSTDNSSFDTSASEEEDSNNEVGSADKGDAYDGEDGGLMIIDSSFPGNDDDYDDDNEDDDISDGDGYDYDSQDEDEEEELSEEDLAVFDNMDWEDEGSPMELSPEPTSRPGSENKAASKGVNSGGMPQVIDSVESPDGGDFGEEEEDSFIPFSPETVVYVDEGVGNGTSSGFDYTKNPESQIFRANILARLRKLYADGPFTSVEIPLGESPDPAAVEDRALRWAGAICKVCLVQVSTADARVRTVGVAGEATGSHLVCRFCARFIDAFPEEPARSLWVQAAHDIYREESAVCIYCKICTTSLASPSSSSSSTTTTTDGREGEEIGGNGQKPGVCQACRLYRDLHHPAQPALECVEYQTSIETPFWGRGPNGPVCPSCSRHRQERLLLVPWGFVSTEARLRGAEVPRCASCGTNSSNVTVNGSEVVSYFGHGRWTWGPHGVPWCLGCTFFKEQSSVMMESFLQAAITGSCASCLGKWSPAWHRGPQRDGPSVCHWCFYPFGDERRARQPECGRCGTQLPRTWYHADFLPGILPSMLRQEACRRCLTLTERGADDDWPAIYERRRRRRKRRKLRRRGGVDWDWGRGDPRLFFDW